MSSIFLEYSKDAKEPNFSKEESKKANHPPCMSFIRNLWWSVDTMCLIQHDTVSPHINLKNRTHLLIYKIFIQEIQSLTVYAFICLK